MSQERETTVRPPAAVPGSPLSIRASALPGQLAGSVRPADAHGRNAPRLPKGVNLLDLLPVRLAAWEESAGERVTLLRPRPLAAGLGGYFLRLSSWLAPPRLRLDPIGSQAWRALDGTHSVGLVATGLRERFGEDAEPVEERLGKLLRLLRRDGFLALPPYDEVSVRTE